MNIIQKSKIWEKSPFDSKTINKVRELKKNPDLLYDSFYKNLEFGTGGIRGIMGVGTNRVNKYTIGKIKKELDQKTKDDIQFSHERVRKLDRKSVV